LVLTPLRQKIAGADCAEEKSMTNTEFILREKSGGQVPLGKTSGIQFGLVEAALVLAFLGVFVGLVFLLSK
jgi:hypothetical protein